MSNKILIIPLYLICFSSLAQLSNSSFKDLFQAAVAYQAVANVCGDREAIDKSKKILRRVLNFGVHQNLLNDEARYFIKNSEEIISRGEALYRRDKYIGCLQAKDVINQLDSATKNLP